MINAMLESIMSKIYISGDNSGNISGDNSGAKSGANVPETKGELNMLLGLDMSKLQDNKTQKPFAENTE